jgi:DNA-binding MarR family transcriptional regulator
MERFVTPDLVIEETGDAVPEQQAYLNLIRTAEVLSIGLSDMLGAHGLSGKQYNILRALRRGGPEGLTISQVGEQMTDPRADVTRLMDRLERERWVERHHDTRDRRVVRAQLTRSGAELLARLDAPVVALHQAQLGHMTPGELGHLIALLRKARDEGQGRVRSRSSTLGTKAS